MSAKILAAITLPRGITQSTTSIEPLTTPLTLASISRRFEIRRDVRRSRGSPARRTQSSYPVSRMEEGSSLGYTPSLSRHGIPCRTDQYQVSNQMTLCLPICALESDVTFPDHEEYT